MLVLNRKFVTEVLRIPRYCMCTIRRNTAQHHTGNVEQHPGPQPLIRNIPLPQEKSSTQRELRQLRGARIWDPNPQPPRQITCLVAVTDEALAGVHPEVSKDSLLHASCNTRRKEGQIVRLMGLESITLSLDLELAYAM